MNGECEECKEHPTDCDCNSVVLTRKKTWLEKICCSIFHMKTPHWTGNMIWHPSMRQYEQEIIWTCDTCEELGLYD